MNKYYIRFWIPRLITDPLTHRLIQTVAAAVGTQPTQAILDELEKRFQELLKLFLVTGTITIDTVEDMLHLIRLSVKIRRPFHERTVALIRILRLLDEETVKANINALGRRKLKEYVPISSLGRILIRFVY